MIKKEHTSYERTFLQERKLLLLHKQYIPSFISCKLKKLENNIFYRKLKKKNMKYNFFTYGILILESCPVKVKTIWDAFILEHKLQLNLKKRHPHALLIAQHTGKATDIISGYLAEITVEELQKIDGYLGKEYERVDLFVFKIIGKESVKAFMYRKKPR